MGTSYTECIDYFNESKIEYKTSVNSNNSDKNHKGILKESSLRNIINNHENNINNNFSNSSFYI